MMNSIFFDIQLQIHQRGMITINNFLEKFLIYPCQSKNVEDKVNSKEKIKFTILNKFSIVTGKKC